jgi:hypothetical protein
VRHFSLIFHHVKKSLLAELFHESGKMRLFDFTFRYVTIICFVERRVARIFHNGLCSSLICGTVIK